MPDLSASLRGVRGDREYKREVILDAAEALFCAKGYHLTTTDAIASESGYSVGTLYNVIGEKEAIFAEVVNRVGHLVVERTKSIAASEHDPERAIERIINLRLYNFARDRLFFEAFSYEGRCGVLPEPERLPARVQALHKEYVRRVGGLFRRVLDRQGIRDANPVNLVLSMEANINAFMAFWERPGQSSTLETIGQHIKVMLLSPVTLQRIGAALENPPEEPEQRPVHINRFDVERLHELIGVAKRFGRSDALCHLNHLEQRLAHAKIVQPQEVPPDIVTMNSVVVVRDESNGTRETRALVFPKETLAKHENTSILSPLGTALLGSRIGDVVEVPGETASRRYLIEDIQYQPERAGDYHL